MKSNNKGVTIVELIVSFAIVAVAIIYFFQTLTTVNKLYKTARKETNEYVEKTYILKIVDTSFDIVIANGLNEELCSEPVIPIKLSNDMPIIKDYYYQQRRIDNNTCQVNIIKPDGAYFTTLYKYIPKPTTP